MPLVIRPKRGEKKKKKAFYFKEQQFRLQATNQHLPLLQCTLLQGEGRQVPDLGAAVYRNCSAGGGRERERWLPGSPSPLCTAVLFWGGLAARPFVVRVFSSFPAAALEMGNAGPGCVFPRISHRTVLFARSEKPADLLQMSFHWFYFPYSTRAYSGTRTANEL